MNTGPSVLFRCDGSSEIGLGHVVRCLALADELREAHGCQVAFAMRHGPLGFEMVREKGYPVLTPSDDDQSFNYVRWLAEAISNVDAQTLVLDVRDNLPRAAVETLRGKGVLIVTLDDPSERRLAADLAFYPPVPQVKRLDWDGFTGQLYVGWEWVVLRGEFAHALSKDQELRTKNQEPRILVTMGGSDPADLTLKAVEALDLLDEDFEAVVVLGLGFSHHEALKGLLAKTRRHFDVRQNVTDMPSLMAQADLAVASFGVTAYELAAMGVPAIYLCLTQDHAKSASAFVEAGMAVCLGEFVDVTEAALVEAVSGLLDDKSKRIQMAKQASQQVDGKGAMQIALIMVERIGRGG